MAVPKQNLAIPFAVNLDTKTDPFQIAPNNLLSIVNAVYTNDKKISKRNGFGALTNLPANVNATVLTTYSGNLVAIGNSLQAYSADTNQWLNRGLYQPIDLSVLSLVRSSLAQINVDSATADNGLVAVVYLDGDGNNKYQVFDGITGQTIVNATILPSTATNPRVFFLGNYFIVTFMETTGGTTHLRYIAIPTGNPSNPHAPADISTVAYDLTAGYDAYSDGTTLNISWASTDGGGGLRLTQLFSNLILNTARVVESDGNRVNNVSVAVDSVSGQVWVSWHEGASTSIKAAVYSSTLGVVLPPQNVMTNADIATLLISMTSVASNGLMTLFVGLEHTYSYDSSIRTDHVLSNTTTNTGTSSSPVFIASDVNLASKAFYVNGKIYFLAVHGSLYQPTYFLIDSLGDVVMKLAYSNATVWPTNFVLAGANVNGSVVQIAYLYRDLIQSVNKNINPTTVNGIYTQTGVNLAKIDLTSGNIVTAEIGGNLHIAGGFVWMYDGNVTVEHNFHLWPENIEATTSPAGGFLEDQVYNYQVTYEWTDSQGNIHRSAPSVPLSITTTGGNTSSVTLTIPTLRLTYKTSVRIVIYRWSAAQEVFYEVTSITTPLLNDPSVDFVTYVDTLADSSIIGNTILYTTGGVVENIAYPATNVLSLYKSRLMVLDAEDPNVVWFSKQVIQNVPVEPSDLFTQYIAPTIGTQGSTGPVTAMAALDDKFITYKRNAIYYFTGNGPDNTGANNDFSDPIFITSTSGCDNQQSIGFTPMGLMAQSNKGIWLLGRDLSTPYIGSPVEAFNTQVVNSATNIAGTTQIRFCLDNNKALFYDYYYQRWGTFDNIDAISSVVYNGLHTLLTSAGLVLQETPGQYLDNGSPVLMSFQTAWFNLAGLQGYERFFYFYILGQFLSPNDLYVQVAFDYNPSPVQSSIYRANQAGPVYGDDPYYGSSSPYGGPSQLEQVRVFSKTQRCQAFQLTVSEIFNGASLIEGAGLSFSGLNLVFGLKKGYFPIPASQSIG